MAKLTVVHRKFSDGVMVHFGGDIIKDTIRCYYNRQLNGTVLTFTIGCAHTLEFNIKISDGGQWPIQMQFAMFERNSRTENPQRLNLIIIC